MSEDVYGMTKRGSAGAICLAVMQHMAESLGCSRDDLLADIVSVTVDKSTAGMLRRRIKNRRREERRRSIEDVDTNAVLMLAFMGFSRERVSDDMSAGPWFRQGVDALRSCAMRDASEASRGPGNEHH